jgi:hypothetical protein
MISTVVNSIISIVVEYVLVGTVISIVAEQQLLSCYSWLLKNEERYL